MGRQGLWRLYLHLGFQSGGRAFAAPQSAAHTPSSKAAVNAEQGLPDTRLPSRAEQGLRSTSTRLSRPRGTLLNPRPLPSATVSGLRPSHLHCTCWQGPHILQKLPLRIFPGGMVHLAPKGRGTQSTALGGASLRQRKAFIEGPCGQVARHGPPPFLAAPTPPNTLKQDSRSRFQSHFPHTRTS